MNKLELVFASLLLTACAPVQPLPIVQPLAQTTPVVSALNSPDPTPTPTASPAPVAAVPASAAPPPPAQRAGFTPVRGAPTWSGAFAADDEGGIYQMDEPKHQLSRTLPDGASEVVATFPAVPDANGNVQYLGVGKIERGGNGRTFLKAGGRVLMLDGSGKHEQWASDVTDMAAGPRGEVFTLRMPEMPSAAAMEVAPQLRPSIPPITISKFDSSSGVPAWTTKLELEARPASFYLLGNPDGSVTAVASSLATAVRLTAGGKVAATLDLSGIGQKLYQDALDEAKPRFGLLCVLAPGHQSSLEEKSPFELAGIAPDRQGGFYLALVYESTNYGGFSEPEGGVGLTAGTSCGPGKMYSSSLWHADAAGTVARVVAPVERLWVKSLASTSRGELFIATDTGYYRWSPAARKAN